MKLDRFEMKFYESSLQDLGQDLDYWKENYPTLFSSIESAEELKVMREDSFYLSLYDEVKLLGEWDDVEAELEEAFRHLRYYYPDLSSTRILTYIGGLDFQYPVLLIDSGIYVSSDMFLGALHPAYASFPQYISFGFDQKYLVSTIMMEVATHLASWDYGDASLLNFMILEGKKLYFVEAMDPQRQDADVIIYPIEKLDWCVKNESNMWSYFLEEDLLFSTEPKNKDRFINAAPFSKFYKPIDQDSPGRVGAWIGWQIVRSYMTTHEDVSLEELMSETDHRKIFKESRYKPI